MSIKKLSLKNHDEVVALFAEEVDSYYFLLNDMLDQQYEGASFAVYGEYEDGKLASILVNNYQNVSYYAKDERDVEIYKEILAQFSFQKLSGPSRLMAQFLPYVKVQQDTLSYLGVVQQVVLERQYPTLELKRISSSEEIEMQYDLLCSAQEYSMGSKEEYVKYGLEILKKGTDRTVYLSVDGAMVSSSTTVRETRNSAIIIGVVTHPEHRQKGYGTEALLGLFEMLLQEGKFPYLFYNNPAARSVYKKIGMKEVCEWRVIYVE